MKKTVLGLMLALSLGMMAPAAFADAGDAVAGVITFPFRLATGAVGGGIGVVEGSVTGVGDMEKKVFEKQGRSEEDGYVQSNILAWPMDVVLGVVAVPAGVLMGAPRGLRDGFHAGWNLWGDNLPLGTHSDDE